MDQSFFEVWSRGQTDLHRLSSEVLRRRLAETIAWCDSLSWPNGLRSADLRPNLFHQGHDDVVCDVGRSRQQHLRYRDIPVAAGLPKLGNGRLLAYFPDLNLTDGAAEVESEGFFDLFNLPPFDTWVTFFEDTSRDLSDRQQLLCYVPAPAVSRATAGIDVNPEECILWLDQTLGGTKELLARLLEQK